MTTPGHRLRAHRRAALPRAELQQTVQSFLKFFGLHVIRIAAKAGVTPARVYGIRASMAQAAEFFEMRVGNALMLERFSQRLAIELRIMSRPRNGPYVHQLVRSEERRVGKE